MAHHRPQMSYLSVAQAEEIHAASLEILSRVGALIDDPEAATLLRRAGATPDEEGRLRIPPQAVERALASAPRRIVLHDREGRPVMPLEPGRVYFGPGSDCLFLLDHRTGARRAATLADLDEAVRLCDALPQIDFLMSCLLPADAPPQAANRLQMRAMIAGSGKPILFVTNDFESCLDVVRAAEHVAEAAGGSGAQALARKPYCACYINVTAPLRHNADSLRKLLFLAEKGLPTTYTPMVLRGVSGPVTTAGAIALANAGELVGVVLSQLKREGAPIIHSGGYGDVFDMGTMTGVYAGPESYGGRAALGAWYGLPTFGLGGAGDSKLPDEQAAAEASLTLLTEALAGMNLIHDVGYLESGKCFSPELLAMSDDIIAWVRRYCRGFEVTRETLALDLIAELGADGDYLGSDHTAAHFREDWYPRLFDRNHFDRWTEEGAQSLRLRAARRVQELLESHRPANLEPGLRREIDGVLA